jgi:hypothetical protein
MAKKAKKVEQQVQVITEFELVALETTRLQLAEARKKVRELEAATEQREANLIAALKAGAVVDGNRTAVVETVTGPSRPKWKEAYVEHFQEEHGETQEAIELRLQKKYPGKECEVLVVGVKPQSV